MIEKLFVDYGQCVRKGISKLTHEKCINFRLMFENDDNVYPKVKECHIYNDDIKSNAIVPYFITTRISFDHMIR